MILIDEKGKLRMDLWYQRKADVFKNMVDYRTRYPNFVAYWREYDEEAGQFIRGKQL